jgi:hypothetical protein
MSRRIRPSDKKTLQYWHIYRVSCIDFFYSIPISIPFMQSASSVHVHTYASPVFDTNAPLHTCSYLLCEPLNPRDRTIGTGDIVCFKNSYSTALLPPTEYGTITGIAGNITSHVVYTLRHSSTQRLHYLYVHIGNARRVTVWQRVVEWLGSPMELAHRY